MSALARRWLIAHATENEVSYRKQIARQHSCHRTFWLVTRMIERVKIFLSSSLIIMQNLLIMCHLYGRSSKNFGGRLGPAPLECQRG